jgi:hypothetical protein
MGPFAARTRAYAPIFISSKRLPAPVVLAFHPHIKVLFVLVMHIPPVGGPWPASSLFSG